MAKRAVTNNITSQKKITIISNKYKIGSLNNEKS